MRILHMLPDIGISNGIMSVILNYAKAMPDDIKFDVVYFADKPETRKSDIEALGGRVYKINPPSPKTAIKGEMSAFFKSHKGEWEVLHINAPHFAVFIAAFAKKAGIKKICSHCHSTLFSLNPENLKRNEIFFKLGKPFVGKSFACSKAAGEYWYGKNFTVLNNAIDCEKYTFSEETRSRVRKELNITDETVIAHIGRTDVIQKNHPFIFKVFAELLKLKSNSLLLLIGATADEKTKALCSELCITDRVVFMGIRDDVNELLQGADAFLFPSTNEGLPVSVIEAQAAGLPVLMSSCVTDEVLVTQEAHSMSLDEPASKWAESLIKLSSLPKKNNYEIMRASGWNIFDCADKLIEYYRG